MMYKATQITPSDIIKIIKMNDLGFMLLEADGTNIYDLLAKNFSYKDKLRMNGDDSYISYHLFTLLYKKKDKPGKARELMEIRSNAIHNIFLRWTAAGYNVHNEKDPYACNEFTTYLKSIEFTSADYMLLLVNK